VNKVRAKLYLMPKLLALMSTTIETIKLKK